MEDSNAWKTKTIIDPEFYLKFKPKGLNHGLNQGAGNIIGLG